MVMGILEQFNSRMFSTVSVAFVHKSRDCFAESTLMVSTSFAAMALHGITAGAMLIAEEEATLCERVQGHSCEY